MPATKTSPPGSAATAPMRSSNPPGPSIWRTHTVAPDAASILPTKPSQSRPFQALPAANVLPPAPSASACVFGAPIRLPPQLARQSVPNVADVGVGAIGAPTLHTSTAARARKPRDQEIVGPRHSRINCDIGHQDRIAERGAQDRNRSILRNKAPALLDVHPGAITGRCRVLHGDDAGVIPSSATSTLSAASSASARRP